MRGSDSIFVGKFFFFAIIYNIIYYFLLCNIDENLCNNSYISKF